MRVPKEDAQKKICVPSKVKSVNYRGTIVLVMAGPYKSNESVTERGTPCVQYHLSVTHLGHRPLMSKRLLLVLLIAPFSGYGRARNLLYGR